MCTFHVLHANYMQSTPSLEQSKKVESVPLSDNGLPDMP